MQYSQQRSGILYAIYMLLNPIPFGFFVAGLIFDVIYNQTAEILWNKSASWVITIGLVIAIIPRLLNLFYVWFRPVANQRKADIWGFWLYGFAIIAAIFNAFVHSRDAYAIAPANLMLSILTVLLISLHYLYQSTAMHNQLVGD
ncbi:DUF2231 domain-containing protein [Acinetobacter ihumii]|uniref:DUF2231 domain-containing protein n=1 Tax=Acinetobacter ihumii TaxID=2483802 RepID=UPI001031B4DF|nr:DUF2231 domain-containing protein [Acinetobacter ihumii]